MKFKSIQIRGKGRGKKIGIPTINLKIPKNFNLEFGIYAAWVNISDKKFKAALHFGPIPTFGETKESLELMLIDPKREFLDKSPLRLKVEIVKKIRNIKKFNDVKKMVDQIRNDIVRARQFLVRSIGE